MEKAVRRIAKAISSGERIAIWGDFDADGLTAAALLLEGLRELGGDVLYHIPHYLSEGHGLNARFLEALKKQGVDLVITADCGTSNREEVEYAGNLNLEMIITDHHRITSELPRALAVINPHRADSRYPFADLAGVGVVYKLLEALHVTFGRPLEFEDKLDLVALGTIADLVPLLGENRYFVKRGIERLENSRRPGLRELIFLLERQKENEEIGELPLYLAFCLDTIGRTDFASLGIELLITKDEIKAWKLASFVRDQGSERRKVMLENLNFIKERLTASSPILIAEGDFPPGILGSLASLLAFEFQRPAVVIKLYSEICNGSGRSFPYFNLLEALSECADILEQFGGHPTAVGFTIRRSKLDLLRERLCEIAQRKLSELGPPELVIDAELPLEALNEELVRAIGELSPFGPGNPPPAFLSRGVKVREGIKVKEDLELHLELPSGKRVAALAPGSARYAQPLSNFLNIVYTIKPERGGNPFGIEVIDLAPAEGE